MDNKAHDDLIVAIACPTCGVEDKKLCWDLRWTEPSIHSARVAALQEAWDGEYNDRKTVEGKLKQTWQRNSQLVEALMRAKSVLDTIRDEAKQAIGISDYSEMLDALGSIKAQAASASVSAHKEMKAVAPGSEGMYE